MTQYLINHKYLLRKENKDILRFLIKVYSYNLIYTSIQIIIKVKQYVTYPSFRSC